MNASKLRFDTVQLNVGRFPRKNKQKGRKLGRYFDEVTRDVKAFAERPRELEQSVPAVPKESSSPV
jgi:hypothetical protein